MVAARYLRRYLETALLLCFLCFFGRADGGTRSRDFFFFSRVFFRSVPPVIPPGVSTNSLNRALSRSLFSSFFCGFLTSEELLRGVSRNSNTQIRNKVSSTLRIWNAILKPLATVFLDYLFPGYVCPLRAQSDACSHAASPCSAGTNNKFAYARIRIRQSVLNGFSPLAKNSPDLALPFAVDFPAHGI